MSNKKLSKLKDTLINEQRGGQREQDSLETVKRKRRIQELEEAIELEKKRLDDEIILEKKRVDDERKNLELVDREKLLEKQLEKSTTIIFFNFIMDKINSGKHNDKVHKAFIDYMTSYLYTYKDDKLSDFLNGIMKVTNFHNTYDEKYMDNKCIRDAIMNFYNRTYHAL